MSLRGPAQSLARFDRNDGRPACYAHLLLNLPHQRLKVSPMSRHELFLKQQRFLRRFMQIEPCQKPRRTTDRREGVPMESSVLCH